MVRSFLLHHWNNLKSCCPHLTETSLTSVVIAELLLSELSLTVLLLL